MIHLLEHSRLSCLLSVAVLLVLSNKWTFVFYRYKEHDDGMYRLQTVRFESVELSQQLQALENENSMSEGEESEEWQLYEGSYDQEFKNITSQQYEDQLQIKR